MAQIRLCLDPALLSQPNELRRTLEKLYCQGGEYTLIFPSEKLSLVHRVFDEIIRTVGLNSDIDFTFEIEYPAT